MPSTQSLLARVRKLERDRTAAQLSPFAAIYGTFEQFEAECRAEMEAGKLAKDFPIDCLARWERDGTWAQWRRGGNRVWTR
ncbi:MULTISPECIES: hypothetical protein [Frigidibacter]|uniref:hypothetical protein n=1 Tax=Frigidibacter TaxID=1775705 RepID=UPI000F8F23CF|nr:MULTISPECIES: hypothetical protein [Frigidibacter]